MARFNEIPAGGIIMWSGTIATIPSGWALCNGSNGTPDLRDRFIAGARQDSGGVARTNVTGSLLQTGGAATHNHSAATVTPDQNGGGSTVDALNGAISTSSNVPPFYALAFIMKL